MAYCTEAQVQAEFKQLDISSSTAIKSAQVAEFIAEADAEINAIIGTRYTVPVTSGDALVLCRLMSRAIVSDRVAGVLQIKSGQAKADQDARKPMTRADALKLAERIAKGEIAFAGAIPISGDDGVKAFVSGTDVERTFKRGETQW